jgi:hypothetical protein
MMCEACSRDANWIVISKTLLMLNWSKYGVLMHSNHRIGVVFFQTSTHLVYLKVTWLKSGRVRSFHAETS